MSHDPIAVFDSGIGGLSVVRHLRQLLPHENIAYFGDTARVPYGSKSRQTVVSFSLDIARFLMQFDPKLMVVACNTASALALDELCAELPIPVVGVVEPGALAAARLAASGEVLVLGTEATINSGAYTRAITAAEPGVSVISQACPLLVPLVEEGRDSSDAIVEMTIRDYLRVIGGRRISAAVLGCTHYPLLRDAIAGALGPDVTIIDSGRETSLVVQERLGEVGVLCRDNRAGTLRCFVSDNVTRFQRTGARFLHEGLEHVELVEAERYVSSAMPNATGQ
ncbi:MAG: glutamate racemase [Phycisphaerales bacterium]|nr:glutamate racemase [Phycisphaerales bacterium]